MMIILFRNFSFSGSRNPPCREEKLVGLRYDGIPNTTAERLVSLMASNSFSLDTAKKSLDEDGFFELSAPDMGTQIVGMEEKNFPFLMPYGLIFLKSQVIDNTVREVEPS